MSIIDQRSVARIQAEFPEINYTSSKSVAGGWLHTIALVYASENPRSGLSLVLECLSTENQLEVKTLPSTILPLCPGFERAEDERGITFARWADLPGNNRESSPVDKLRKVLRDLQTWQLSVAIANQSALGNTKENQPERLRMEPKPQQQRFKIVAETPPYTPEEGPIPTFQIEAGESSYLQGISSSDAVLYITEKARIDLFEHIGFGNPRPENRMEQGGILVGRVIRDPRTHEIAAIVESIVPGTGATASPISLELGTEVWASMLARLEAQPKTNHTSNQIIGWYHTHPNNLEVFMSGIDMETQRRLFPRDWQFAVVLNPHQQRWRVFQGANAVECPGHFIQVSTQRNPQVRQPPPHDKRLAVKINHPPLSNAGPIHEEQSARLNRRWILKTMIVFAALILAVLLLLFLVFPEENETLPTENKRGARCDVLESTVPLQETDRKQLHSWWRDMSRADRKQVLNCLEKLPNGTP